MTRHGGTDYGTASGTGGPSNKMHRPASLANNVLHWISSLIVMSIAAYFISAFHNNTHMVYWLTIAAIDALLFIPAMLLPASNKYKGYMWPLHWIFSYLWLTAFIFAAQDYNSSPGCWAYSPSFVNKCALKKTLEAFAFLAFFTNLVGTLLEGRLFDIQRFKTPHNAVNDKHATGGVLPHDASHTAPHGAQPVV